MAELLIEALTARAIQQLLQLLLPTGKGLEAHRAVLNARLGAELAGLGVRVALGFQLAHRWLVRELPDRTREAFGRIDQALGRSRTLNQNVRTGIKRAFHRGRAGARRPRNRRRLVRRHEERVAGTRRLRDIRRLRYPVCLHVRADARRSPSGSHPEVDGSPYGPRHSSPRTARRSRPCTAPCRRAWRP